MRNFWHATPREVFLSIGLGLGDIVVAGEEAADEDIESGDRFRSRSFIGEEEEEEEEEEEKQRA